MYQERYLRFLVHIFYYLKNIHPMRLFLLFAALLVSNTLSAQLKVEYQQTVKIPDDIKNMEDIAQREFIINEIRKSQTVFTLAMHNGVVGFTPSQINDNTLNINGGGSIYADLSENKKYSIKSILDKQFLVKDSIKTINWNISDETKEIQNYTCRKATYGDTIAWYCEQLPMPVGPCGVFGLPGIVLELHTQAESFNAISLEMSNSNNFDIALLMPKDNAISESEYRKIKAKKLKEMGIEGDKSTEKGKVQVKIITM